MLQFSEFSCHFSTYRFAVDVWVRFTFAYFFGFSSFQARTLAPQLADSEHNEIRFFVATQTLKPQNQIHLVEVNDTKSTLKQQV